MNKQGIYNKYSAIVDTMADFHSENSIFANNPDMVFVKEALANDPKDVQEIVGEEFYGNWYQKNEFGELELQELAIDDIKDRQEVNVELGNDFINKIEKGVGEKLPKDYQDNLEFYDALHDKHIKLDESLLDDGLESISLDVDTGEFYIKNDHETESVYWLKDVDNNQDLSDLVMEVAEELSEPNFDEWKMEPEIEMKR